MHDQSLAGPIDWLEFPDVRKKTEDDIIKVNLSFLASNWKCLFGCGCPGIFPKDSKKTVPDLGCCVDGFYVDGKKEQENIERNLAKLTDEDWDTRLRKNVEKRGWMTKGVGKGEKKSRLFEGGCVFANRADGSVGSTGKVGCAFIHLGNRLNGEQNDITDNSKEHHDFMPHVCSQLPLHSYWDDEDVFVITAWSNDMWSERQPIDDDGTSDSFAHWWCVDSPDNYVNSVPVYVSMSKELVSMVGKKNYDMIAKTIEERTAHAGGVKVMPASPEGRKLLNVKPYEDIKTQVGFRTPKR